MPITINGPDWESVRTLRAALSTDPLNGAFTLGGRKLDAIQQFEKFAAAGLSIPEYTTSLEQAQEWVRGGQLVFGRRRLHSQGRDISTQGLKFRRSEFWVKVVTPVISEWRVHILGGKVIARGRKVQVEPPTIDLPIRSRRNGWRLEHSTNPPKGIRRVAKLAVESLGYSGGAVDLLVCSASEELDNSEICVLEVNRLPAIRDAYTQTAYINAIRSAVAAGRDR